MLCLDSAKSLCALIYDFLAVRIRTGYYKKGDQILGKPLSDLFDVSNITVRNALKLLEQDGYVSLSKNRRAIVIWDASNAYTLTEELSPGRETLLDLKKSYGLLLPGIIWQALRQFDDEGLTDLGDYPDKPHLVINKPIIYLIKRVMGQLGNPLLLDLQRDILLFSYSTALSSLGKVQQENQGRLWKLHQSFYQAVELFRKKDFEKAYNMMEEACRHYNQLADYAGMAPQESPGYPYHWGKPSTGASVSCTLSNQIEAGVYLPNTFLPTNDELAKQFSVSKMTIRRAIWTLNSMGLTESVNGVGTKVFSPSKGADKVKWDDPDFRKNLMLFLESLQILALTCRRVTQATFRLIPPEELRRMAGELEEAVCAGFFYACYGAWLGRIIQYSDLACIREIYGRLKSFLVWGKPLRFCDIYKRPPDEVPQAIDSLKRGDMAEYVDIMERYCFRIFSDSRQAIIDQGVRDAEKVAPIEVVRL